MQQRIVLLFLGFLVVLGSVTAAADEQDPLNQSVTGYVPARPPLNYYDLMDEAHEQEQRARQKVLPVTSLPSLKLQGEFGFTKLHEAVLAGDLTKLQEVIKYYVSLKARKDYKPDAAYALLMTKTNKGRTVFDIVQTLDESVFKNKFQIIAYLHAFKKEVEPGWMKQERESIEAEEAQARASQEQLFEQLIAWLKETPKNRMFLLVFQRRMAELFPERAA